MNAADIKHTAKQFVRQLKPTTVRLTLSYLAIIMVMSIGFSVVLYRTSSRELSRQIPPRSLVIGPNGMQSFSTGGLQGYTDFFQQRIDQGRQQLLTNLLLLNVGTLAGGAFLSYYLARRTLQPIERAMEAQSRFTSDASHELRTPLAAIKAENEVALRGSSLTLGRAKEVLASNLEEITRLQQLSDGLLQLTAGRQHVPLKPVWLDEVGAEAMNQIIAPAQAKDIAIDDTLPHIRIMADPQSLSQALVILLDNAIKYSPKKSTIHLEGKTLAKHALINVRDEGIGIAASHLPHVFNRFYRVDQSRTSQRVKGYGLGLSIAKRLVEQQHGAIAAISELDKGSSFTLRLPLAD